MISIFFFVPVQCFQEKDWRSQQKRQKFVERGALSSLALVLSSGSGWVWAHLSRACWVSIKSYLIIENCRLYVLVSPVRFDKGAVLLSLFLNFRGATAAARAVQHHRKKLPCAANLSDLFVIFFMSRILNSSGNVLHKRFSLH